MSYTPRSEHMRAPSNLTSAELRQALDELDAKIKTLNARANATAAGSPHHYHEHAAALEAKRAKLSDQLNATADTDAASGVWGDIKRGIDTLRDDISKFL